MGFREVDVFPREERTAAVLVFAREAVLAPRRGVVADRAGERHHLDPKRTRAQKPKQEKNQCLKEISREEKQRLRRGGVNLASKGSSKKIK